MSKTSTQSKRNYNRGTYKRYEVSVRSDTTLNYILEHYSKTTGDSVSGLIKTLLNDYFELEQDDLFVEYHIGWVDGNHTLIPNPKTNALLERINHKKELKNKF